jgi:hypothetical protein
MRNQNIFTAFLGLAFMLLVGFMLTSANVTKLTPNIYEFEVDTIGASSSGTFTISAQNKSKSGIGFEVRVAVLSGTVDSRIIIQESFFKDQDYWYNRDTVDIAAAGVYKWEDSFRAPWIRAFIQSDAGAQSATYLVAAAAVQEF